MSCLVYCPQVIREFSSQPIIFATYPTGQSYSGIITIPIMSVDTLSWQLLKRIQNIVDQDEVLAKKIQKLGELLLDELPFDALWCITQAPLSPVACGLIATPLSSDAQGTVTLVDYYPSPAPDTLLSRITQSGEPLFFAPDHPDPPMLDGDMGDTLFSTFHAVPVAAIPWVDSNSVLGGIIAGTTNRASKFPPVAWQQLLQYIGVHLGHLLRLYYLEGHHAAQLRALNRLSEILLTTTDVNIIIRQITQNLPRLLPGDVHGILIHVENGTHLGLSLPLDFGQSDAIQKHLIQTLGDLRNSNRISLTSTQTIFKEMPVDPAWQPKDTRSLPILHRKDVIGLLYVATGIPNQYHDEFLRLASLVVSQISSVVANAQLFDQVARERARLAAILTSSTDALLVIDCHRQIVLDNPAALDVLGAVKSRRGHLLHEVTSNQALIELFEQALSRDTTTGEVLLPDGRTFFANLSPVRTDEGEAIGWIATMQDISHFKEVNELKNEFVSTVSHDLRSPLSGILIATRLINQSAYITEEQQELLQLIERRVRGMSTLIDDLLDIGHIEAGIDLELVDCNLETIVVEVRGCVRVWGKGIHRLHGLYLTGTIVCVNLWTIFEHIPWRIGLPLN
jgi:PAS domain S-box-containing protein